MKPSLREKCPMQNYFWSVFSRSRTEYGEILSPNTGKYGPEITPHLDTFHSVHLMATYILILMFACFKLSIAFAILLKLLSSAKL